MTTVNHYAVLGVPHTAGAAEIRDAYVRRLKGSHPDLDPRGYPTARVDELQRAYRCLRDPEARSVHDAELHAAELVRADRLRRVRRRLLARAAGTPAHGRRGRPVRGARWRRMLPVAVLALVGGRLLGWL